MTDYSNIYQLKYAWHRLTPRWNWRPLLNYSRHQWVFRKT